MFRKVIVKDKYSHEMINEYLIELGPNAHREEFFESAWLKAVNDGLVDEHNRNNYFKKLEEEDPLI